MQLIKTAGVLILGIDNNGIIDKYKIVPGNMIINGAGETINTIPYLMKVFKDIIRWG